jgi:hypothetical protein
MAFHWKEGWYFERITDPNPEYYGWVRIYHHPAAGQDSVGVSLLIEPHSWASIVASVCPEGETSYTFGLAKAIHGVLEYMA